MSRYDDLLQKLFRLGKDRGTNPSLDNMRKALDRLGNPQNSFRSIHITGTNGKGSVSSMLFYILKQNQNAGLYTSPFLVDFRERIRTSEGYISEEDVLRIYETIRLTNVELTYFEISTIMAFIYFSEKKIDIAVIEVGMGGRWDATNVIVPILSIITRTGIDHSRLLGDNIEQIVTEKSGIIKSGVPVITLSDNAGLNIIKEKATSAGSDFLLVDPESDHSLKPRYLKGSFQNENINIAVAAARHLAIDSSQIRDGIENTKWPGRMEFLRPNLLADGAHNPLGMEILHREIRKLGFRKKVLVFGCMEDKEYDKMLNQINEDVDEIIYTKPDIWRALDPEILHTSKKSTIIDIHRLWSYLKPRVEDEEDTIFIIAGSLYLVGQFYQEYHYDMFDQ